MKNIPTANALLFQPDIDKLISMHGKPIRQAVHLILANAPCDHPEAKRAYTTAMIREDGEAFNQGEPGAKLIALAGFRCGACKRYVFEGR